ncbi:MAG: hypothetical protein KTR35_23690 [Gammaproteobacteria bacterium]|nr:hypothetical protein [Gammaproteobacteria bacterium]
MITINKRRLFLSLLLLAGLTTLTACDSGSSGGIQFPAELTEGNSSLGNFDPVEQPLEDAAPNDNSALRFANCDLEIPCDWFSLDLAIEVSIVNVYADPLTNRLEVQYTLTTTHDTSLRWLATATAVDSVGQVYALASTRLDTTGEILSDDQEVDLLAGIGLTITQTFQQSPAHSTRSIARLTINILEGGTKHRIGYLDLPLGADTGEEVDCANRTPCVWESANGEFHVTILSADGLSSGGRLTVRYEVEAFENIVIQSDPGSIAVGNDGTTFEPKFHKLGDEEDYLPFETNLFSGEAIPGSQSYFRHANRDATMLRKLSLKLSQIGAPQAGSPVYINVPLN